MAWLYYLLLLIVSITGLFLNILGLPGLWLIVGATAAYAWITGWELYVGWPSIMTLIILGLAAEVLEFAAGAAGSKAAGGRIRGMIGAVVGAVIGGIFLSFVPVPVVSTIVGACAGAFLGASIMEYWDRDIHHAMRVGVGAAKGRFAGIVVKSAIGIAMVLVVLVAAIPLGSRAAPAPLPSRAVPYAPATTMSTAPSTTP